MNDGSVARLGIDWGTSNRRAYMLDEQGRLLRQHEDDEGILKAGGNFQASLQRLLQQLELREADIIASGMIGSRNGWQEVPYAGVEQPLTGLGAAMTAVDTGIPGVRLRIVPGYRYLDAHGVPDVMRGEETQLLGALALGAGDGWFLLPGTHSKWARIEDGRLRQFLTFMTGELYALLTQHGTLAKLMDARREAPEAFAAGIEAGRHSGFTHAAFGCRALVVTDMMAAERSASYLSGLLIGAELQEIGRRSDTVEGETVQVIGSPALAGRYLDALDLSGFIARGWQPDTVYLAALRALFDIAEVNT